MPAVVSTENRAALISRYRSVRAETEARCRPLSAEDCLLQSMPGASPAKWHLAHTTWFFETFLLIPHAPGYQLHHPEYPYLFNSYYNAVGERWARPARGLLSRPTVEEVYTYRRAVDQRVLEWLRRADDAALATSLPLIELGLNHEQQHQELLLTDLKHAFSLNPLRPAYQSPAPRRSAPSAPRTRRRPGRARSRWGPRTGRT